MIRVLFVCLGNICRSPMAEGVFAYQVKQAGLSDHFQIDSAGTSDWHKGETAHKRTLGLLKARSIPYDNRSRPLSLTDAESFDVIVVMDETNLRDTKRLFQGSSHAPDVRLFLQDAYDAGLVDVKEVPDPYYTDRYEDVYELVEVGSKALLDRLRKEHGL